MTPEGKVKHALMQALKRENIDSVFSIAEKSIGIVISLEMFRIKGLPDKVVLLKGGKVVFIEVKREIGGELSIYQNRVIGILMDLAFDVRVVSNKDAIKIVVAELVAMAEG